ncbi:Na+/H+ antiporter NhaA [Hydrogenimonas cancrithermarum]|uniref:Na(+)/H(+) antiporter NhaA n=1 Tax=Hydrogenimonas cancrithermarum TaxID=2993563 RepID=A0ABN6WTK0_9BACT|nr:Na+/H+ antiporter NhaA [Hydrogenimonas cancrithermarum]BDY12000.1 Na(+)/H(+) antiporter NhaA [Hydrogenimonas cancrithermarum]
MKDTLFNFFKKESSTGILLMLATLIAMTAANSPLKSYYELFTEIPVVISFGELTIAKPLLLWINDGLMALFFFMVGLEIKREMFEGELGKPGKIALPAFAAVGGMAAPALIYALFNWSDPAAMKGWAIPAATDIAFALGILSLLGKRVPVGLKLFLLTLAIIDDLGAIVIIAFFYTSQLSMLALGIAAAMLALLFSMNRYGVVNNTMYILVGIVLWTALLKSGVHATLAGVMLGLFIPIRNNKASFYHLEHSLYRPVNHIILPLFAFVNTGIDFSGVKVSDFTDSITLGIAFGLFFGKQIGIFLFSYLAVALKLGSLPEGVAWRHIYGAAMLGGIGFTMSLFIGSLAFECSGEGCLQQVDERMGILIGSLFSGLAGYLFFRFVSRHSN